MIYIRMQYELPMLQANSSRSKCGWTASFFIFFIFLFISLPEDTESQNADSICSTGHPKSKMGNNEKLGTYCEMEGRDKPGLWMLDKNGEMDCRYCCANHKWDEETKSCVKCPAGTTREEGPYKDCIAVDPYSPNTYPSATMTPPSTARQTDRNNEDSQTVINNPCTHRTTEKPTKEPNSRIPTTTSEHPQDNHPDNKDPDAQTTWVTVVVIVAVVLTLHIIIAIARNKRKHSGRSSSDQGYHSTPTVASDDPSSSLDTSMESVQLTMQSE